MQHQLSSSLGEQETSISHPYSTGWWLGHPSEKYEFVNWDDDRNPILMGKCKIHGNQTTNQSKLIAIRWTHNVLRIQSRALQLCDPGWRLRPPAALIGQRRRLRAYRFCTNHIVILIIHLILTNILSEHMYIYIYIPCINIQHYHVIIWFVKINNDQVSYLNFSTRIRLIFFDIIWCVWNQQSWKRMFWSSVTALAFHQNHSFNSFLRSFPAAILRPRRGESHTRPLESPRFAHSTGLRW